MIVQSDSERLTMACAFGRALRNARQGAGLSQEALAEAAGVDRTYPSLLERGLREPSLGIVCRLGEALKVSPEVLVRATLGQLACGKLPMHPDVSDAREPVDHRPAVEHRGR
jgi:transcriptional regulator with XRE-family HTH domain